MSEKLKAAQLNFVAIGLCIIVFIVSVFVSNLLPAQAAVPRYINYQSRLRASTTAPITVSTTIQFSIYNSSTAIDNTADSSGPLLWTETYNAGSGACAQVQPDSKGYFTVALGTCSNFPSYIDFTQPLYLGVKIDDDAEASPRVSLNAYPYALNSHSVNGIQASSTATANQLLSLDANLGFNINTGLFSGGLFTMSSTTATSSVAGHFSVSGYSTFSTTTASQLLVNTNAPAATALMTLQNQGGDFQIFQTTASPSGILAGSVGDVAVDSTNGNIYFKHTGSNTNTGWTAFVTEESIASSTAFVLGGNYFAQNATLGTNDNYSLTLETNNIPAITIATDQGVSFASSVSFLANNSQIRVQDGQIGALAIYGGSNQFLKIDTETTDRIILGNNTTNLTVSLSGNSLQTSGELTMGGRIVMGGNKITGLGDPTNSSDAVNLGYLSSLVRGLVWQDPVLSISNDPPGLPAVNDRYIVGPTPTAAWVYATNAIAVYVGGGNWATTAATSGMAAYVSSTVQQYTFNGGSWVSIANGVNHNNTTGLQGGLDSQYYHLNLAQYNTIKDDLTATTSNNFLVANGDRWVSQSTSSVRQVLGLDISQTANFTNLNITGSATTTNLVVTNNATINNLTVTSSATLATTTITRLTVTGTSTLATTTITNLNVTGTTTLASTTITDLTVQRLTVTGTTTLATTTITNLTVSGSTTLATTTISNLIATNLTGTNATFTNLFATNTTLVNATATNFRATTSTFNYLQANNVDLTNLLFTNGTGTRLFVATSTFNVVTVNNTSTFTGPMLAGSYLQMTTAGNNFLYFGNATSKYLEWDNTNNKFVFSHGIDVTGFVTSTGLYVQTGSSTFASPVVLNSFNPKSVLFVGPNKEIAQNNASFTWDNTNGRLGIGTSTPRKSLDVNGDVLNVVSDNNSITRLATTTVGAAGPISSFVNGKYVYTANADASFSVIDVTNPSSPTTVATTSVGTWPNGMYVSGRYAYIADTITNVGQLRIVDISNPRKPVLVSSLVVGDQPTHAYVFGKYVYLTNFGNNTANDGNKVIVVDVSDILNPRIVTKVSLGTGSGPIQIVGNGRYAYTANNTNTTNGNNLAIIDISDPQNATLVATTSQLGGGASTPSGIALYGRYALTANTGTNNISVIDVSSSTKPVEVSTISVNEGPLSIFTAGKYAYVICNAASGQDKIDVIDLSNPLSPVVVSRINSGNYPTSLFVSGKYLYGTDYDGLLTVYSINGIETSAMLAHSLEVGELQALQNVTIQGQMRIAGGINAGIAGILSNGALSVLSTSTPSYFGGKIGVGTTTPTFNLDVVGDINATGTVRIAGFDYGRFFINATGTNGQLWRSDGDGRGYWATTSDLGININDIVGSTTIAYLSANNIFTGQNIFNSSTTFNGTTTFATTTFIGPITFNTASGTTITATTGTFNNIVINGAGAVSTTNILAQNITTTNLFATSANFVNASSTNFYASSSTFRALSLTGMTQGSVLFIGPNSALTQNNNLFYWDNSNYRFGIGTSTPSAMLTVQGTSTNPLVYWMTSTTAPVLHVTASGTVAFNTSTHYANSLLDIAGDVSIWGDNKALKFGASSSLHLGTQSIGGSANNLNSTRGLYLENTENELNSGLFINGARLAMWTEGGNIEFLDGSASGYPTAISFDNSGRILLERKNSGTRTGYIGVTSSANSARMAFNDSDLSDNIYFENARIGIQTDRSTISSIGTDTPTLYMKDWQVASSTILNIDANTGKQAALMFSVSSPKAAIFLDTDNSLKFTASSTSITSDALRAASVRMTLDKYGNVGIGTTTPSSTLTVAGSFRLTGAFADTRNATGTYQQVLISAGTSTYWVSTSTLGFGAGGSTNPAGSDTQIQFNNGGTSFGADSNFTWGNSEKRLMVGSGSTYVSSSPGAINIYNSSGNASLQLATEYSSLAYKWKMFADSNSGNFVLANFNNDIINSSLLNAYWDVSGAQGYIGIGTSTPYAKLSVTTTNSNNNEYALTVWNNTNRLIDVRNDAFIQMGTSSFITMDTNARLGINTSTPLYSLDLVGSAYLRGSANASGLFVSTTGNVGIGTTTPTSKFDVAGTAQLRGGTGNTGLTVDSSGRVGIGTTTPVTALQVVGTSTMHNIIPDMAGGTGNVSLYNLGSTTTRWNALYASTTYIGPNTWAISMTANGSLSFTDLASGVSRIQFTTSGRAIFATSSDGYGLDIVGGLKMVASATPTNPVNGSIFYSPTTSKFMFYEGGEWVSYVATTTQSGGTLDGTGAANKIAFWTDSNTLSNNTFFHWDNTNMRLGIGTTTPSTTLSINTTSSNSVLTISASSTYKTGINYQINGTPLFYNWVDVTDVSAYKIIGAGQASAAIGISTLGTVGIGGDPDIVADPTMYTLKVTGTQQITQGLLIDAGGITVTTGDLTMTAGNVSAPLGAISGATVSAGAGGLHGSCSGTVVEGPPSNFTFTGCLDFAEIYPSVNGVEPGDVVVLNNDGKVERSNANYQDNVMGVVSTYPGVILGKDGGVSMAGGYTHDSNNPAIALMGRVPVKVSNENGPIAKGDYLTSASLPGYAMKATKQGKVIGMAMEDFDGVNATGSVVVFMNVHWSGKSQEVLVSSANNYLDFSTSTMLVNEINVISTSTFQGNVYVNNNSEFAGKIKVKNHLELSSDSAGQAKILSGATSVHIAFEQPYQTQPIVTITPIGLANMKYGVNNISGEGFDIVIDPSQTTDVLFNWHAFAASEGSKISVSDGTTQNIIFGLQSSNLNQPLQDAQTPVIVDTTSSQPQVSDSPEIASEVQPSSQAPQPETSSPSETQTSDTPITQEAPAQPTTENAPESTTSNE